MLNSYCPDKPFIDYFRSFIFSISFLGKTLFAFLDSKRDFYTQIKELHHSVLEINWDYL